MSERSVLFVYGTLRDPGLVRQLTGKSFVTEEAWLLGYERRELPQTYPFVVSAPGRQVAGLILRDVDPESLMAFDRYECVGLLYDRVEARARTTDGREETVLVYVARSERLPVREPDRTAGP